MGAVDHFEIVVIVGASFLVNSVTQDGRTNWAEGLIMVGFYTIIVSLSPSFFSNLTNRLAPYPRLWQHGSIPETPTFTSYPTAAPFQRCLTALRTLLPHRNPKGVDGFAVLGFAGLFSFLLAMWCFVYMWRCGMF